MNKDELYLPPDFGTPSGKLRVVDDSLQQLLNATERMATAEPGEVGDATVELLADISAALIVLHMVVADMLQDR